MLSSRTAFRKTKGGKVLRVTREHYLRDDIWCGSRACQTCAQDGDRATLPSAESVEGAVYLIVHPSLMLHQVDFLEHQVGNSYDLPEGITTHKADRKSET